MKQYKEMTVAELRAESRRRGMTLQSNGKKFTKPELIERLKRNDAESEEEWGGDAPAQEDSVEAVEAVKEEEAKKEEVKEEKEEEEERQKSEGYIKYAQTLEEIETKYGGGRPQKVLERDLKPGCFVVFVHYVEALDGNVYKKLRTAKVTGVNRTKELVRVQTLLGCNLEFPFEEILYIKSSEGKHSYPNDIKTFLSRQRTEKGRELIHDKLYSAEG